MVASSTACGTARQRSSLTPGTGIDRSSKTAAAIRSGRAAANRILHAAANGRSSAAPTPQPGCRSESIEAVAETGRRAAGNICPRSESI